MSNLDKKEKVLLILEKVKKDGITAYDLSKKLSISESGLNKLFRGEIKNPHNSTVSALYEHLFEKEIVKEDENKVTIEGHTFKIPIISLAILENREKFLKD